MATVLKDLEKDKTMNETISGRELDKAFAKATGFYVESVVWKFGLTEYRLRNKNGWYSRYLQKTEVGAWNKVSRFGSARNLLGGILATIKDCKWSYKIHDWDDDSCVLCEITDFGPLKIHATGKTPNEAACRAFLAAHEATQAKGEEQHASK